VDRIVLSARGHGKTSGILVRHSDDWTRIQSLGLNWLAMDSDLSILREGFRRLRHSAIS
jgi:2-keto-3-deoxy-L-rhamnonate aldolase RhmA